MPSDINDTPNSPLGASTAEYVNPLGTWTPWLYFLKCEIRDSIELYLTFLESLRLLYLYKKSKKERKSCSFLGFTFWPRVSPLSWLGLSESRVRFESS